MLDREVLELLLEVLELLLEVLGRVAAFVHQGGHQAVRVVHGVLWTVHELFLRAAPVPGVPIPDTAVQRLDVQSVMPLLAGPELTLAGHAAAGIPHRSFILRAETLPQLPAAHDHRREASLST
nr:hypothetical protein HEP87_07495 [Streptomyces sp. S1D4-11]